MSETKTQQKNETETKKETQVKEYKIIGENIKKKKQAEKKLAETFSKGFKGARLIVSGNEFMILFGTYKTEQMAKDSVAAIKKAGITASIMK